MDEDTAAAAVYPASAVHASANCAWAPEPADEACCRSQSRARGLGIRSWAARALTKMVMSVAGAAEWERSRPQAV